jgi:LysM repeat protein
LAFSLLSGTIFLPIQTVNADTNTVTPPPSGDAQNLQNLSILSAGVSSSSVSQNNSKTDKISDIDTNASVNIVSDNAILPATGPTGVSDGTNSSDSSNDTSVYVVRQGDAIADIAKMFGVSVNTILWANDMKKGDKLTPGDVLLILPISGVEHKVTKGQTVQSIAKLYKVEVNDILQNNDISLDTSLKVGDTLIIPNGEKSQEGDKPIKDTKASAAKDKLYYEKHNIKNIAEYFIDPVPGYRLSQGIHDNNAVDLATAKGTPVHAAASGIVTFAKLGYNGGFGGLVIIKHPNGTETLYAHLSNLSIHTGENVSQGEVIAASGGVPGTPYSGHSTGAHLHFEVHGARNPGADNSWKY